MSIRSDKMKGMSYTELGKKYNIDPRTAKRYAESGIRPEYTLTEPKPIGASFADTDTGKCSKCKPEFYFEIQGDTAIGTLPSGDKFTIDAEDIPLVSK